jgi:hypothetical protein
MARVMMASFVIWTLPLVTAVLLAHRQEAAASHRAFWWWSHLNDINCKPSQRVEVGARCYLLYRTG